MNVGRWSFISPLVFIASFFKFGFNFTEEEVILWVTSELGPASAAVSEEQSGASDAIPVTLIGQSDEHLVQTEVNTVHFDDVKENYTIVVRKIISLNEYSVII